ncbi:hypothetical protein [Enterobacter cloacae complex sp. 288G10]|uniref:hypothetical protein n=1 Tax=Enterobacter cloacae complex sp. 288G10 TaxID=3395859 RepID=UPI003CF86915
MPDYHQPGNSDPVEVESTGSFSFREQTFARSSAPYFNDEKLQQLIKLTIAGNKDLQVSALNLKRFRGTIWCRPFVHAS